MVKKKEVNNEVATVDQEGLIKKHTLFEISNELDSIFLELEDNGGELTPEISQRLEVTETNFNRKVQSYINAIKALKMQVEACKEEKKRIDALKKRDENHINFLNSVLSTVTQKFGKDVGKSRVIELPLGKVLIRPSKAIDVDVASMGKILDMLHEFYFEKSNNNEDIFDEPAATINEFFDRVSNEFEDSNIKVELEDLSALRLKVTLNCGLFDFMFDQWMMDKWLDGSLEPSIDMSIEYIKKYEEDGKKFAFAKQSEKMVVSVK